MTAITIPLEELVIDPGENPDLSVLPEEELLRSVKEHLGFLSPHADIAVEGNDVQMILPDPSGYQRDRAEHAYERASHARAIRLFREVVEVMPGHTELCQPIPLT